jgi:hypothetical protein
LGKRCRAACQTKERKEQEGEKVLQGNDQVKVDEKAGQTGCLRACFFKNQAFLPAVKKAGKLEPVYLPIVILRGRRR